MSEIPFHATRYGHAFFSHQLPELLDTLTRIANALEKHEAPQVIKVADAEIVEKNRQLASINTLLEKKLADALVLVDETIQVIDKAIKAAKE
jgi:hypothetical protein